MTSWQREFSQWAPDINIVTYLGDVVSRDIVKIIVNIFNTNHDVLCYFRYVPMNGVTQDLKD